MIPVADRITPAYVDLQRKLHARPEGYGGKGSRWAETVLAVCKQYDAHSVLDYGTGQGTLARELRRRHKRLDVREYDPAIPGKDGPPSFADVVTITDVCEHIEPDMLPAVLKHLHQLARKAVFAVVSTREANKTLADGRNAHLIIQPGEWWAEQVQAAGFRLAPVPDVAPEKKPGKAWVAVWVPEPRA